MISLRVVSTKGRIPLVSGLLIGALSFAGCGGDGNPGDVPESKSTKATSDFMNNPFSKPKAGAQPKAATNPDGTPKMPK